MRLDKAIVTVTVHRLGKGGSTYEVGSERHAAAFVLPCWRPPLAPDGKHTVIAKYRPTHIHTGGPLVLASHKVAVRHARTNSPANPPFLPAHLCT